jgi:hypothetical protein
VARSNPLKKQVTAAKRALRDLERMLDRIAKSARNGVSSGRGAPAGRRLKLTPRRKAELKLHGRYLGHIRLLKPAQKARVRAVREKKGYPAAIKLAQQLSK